MVCEKNFKVTINIYKKQRLPVITLCKKNKKFTEDICPNTIHTGEKLFGSCCF